MLGWASSSSRAPVISLVDKELQAISIEGIPSLVPDKLVQTCSQIGAVAGTDSRTMDGLQVIGMERLPYLFFCGS